MTQPNHCARCGKWAGAHATLPGQPTDHLCMCVPAPAPVGLVPLTSAQLIHLFAELNKPCVEAPGPFDMFKVIVSAIERAHGIKAGKDGAK